MPRSQARAGLINQLDRAAEFWLGYERASMVRRGVNLDWCPDDAAAYCSRCGESTGVHESTSTGCGSCRSRSLPFARCVRLGKYDNELREWIHAIKFHRRWEIGVMLGRLLGEAVDRQANLPGDRETVVVPVPMPWPRRLHRGLDHTRVLARAVAAVLGAQVVQPLVHRNGPPQVSLTSTERRRAASRLIGRRATTSRPLTWLSTPPLRDTEVILVDDVRTTGATTEAASRLLNRFAPHSITVAVVAVADAAGRTGRVEATAGAESANQPVAIG